MIHQMFVAKSGMFAYQRSMQLITNNIANSQTLGFKGSRVEMESLFPLILERTLTEFEESNTSTVSKRRKYITYGTGVRIAEVKKDFSQGTIEITNQPLDMAIEGNGLFQVRLPDGTMGYTRAGNFHQDQEGNVLDANGHPLEPSIRIPNGTTEISIDREGRFYVRLNNEPNPREVGQILLGTFHNPAGLKEIGQNLFQETESSGEAQVANAGQEHVGAIKQRSLEFSNVNIVEELVSLLLTQRGFELIVKALQSGDKMMTTASDISR
ncbi:flagellar basal-body rod protein FlgG [bacterium]|jgi:flagellar basal-body rod protein FlgG|nr:flagellar basal-body rod protein FlgG [bacterium]